MTYTKQLEQALMDVITNLQEDVPAEEWSKHLAMAVIDALILLSEKEERI